MLLQDQLRKIDDLLAEQDQQLSELMDSILKVSKDSAKSHIGDLLEVQEERDRLAKNKTSEKAPKKSSKRSRSESQSERRDEATLRAATTTVRDSDRERNHKTTAPEKRSRRSYSRDTGRQDAVTATFGT